jgi:hypothetical protein
MSACSPSVTPRSSAWRPTSPAMPSRSGAGRPSSACLAGAAVAAVLGLVFGLIAIRRQGIYFAMITLALAQMVFFFSLQAPFTGGEDGIQAIPRRPILGLINIQNDLVLYYVVLAIFLFGFAVIYRTVYSPFGQVLKAIRDNEQRAHLARLRGRPLQAGRLRAVGQPWPASPARPRRWSSSSPRSPTSLGNVGRGRPDDAGRRHGHHPRARGRAFDHRHDAELPRLVRRVGAGRSRGPSSSSSSWPSARAWSASSRNGGGGGRPAERGGGSCPPLPFARRTSPYPGGNHRHDRAFRRPAVRRAAQDRYADHHQRGRDLSEESPVPRPLQSVDGELVHRHVDPLHVSRDGRHHRLCRDLRVRPARSELTPAGSPSWTWSTRSTR